MVNGFLFKNLWGFDVGAHLEGDYDVDHVP